MTDTVATAVRPLPLNTILMVSGVSFRQEAVRQVVEHDEVRIVHDRDNQFDANACAVRTIDGQDLGFIPKELAPRLSGANPGGIWRARIEEVLRSETWGLRVRVGPLVQVGAADVGARAPGLRHRGDGTVEASTGAVATTETGPGAEADRPPAVDVFAKSGRRLGRLLSTDGDRMHVLTPAGAKATYPASVVRTSAAA